MPSYDKICERCGEPFTAKSQRAKRCPPCTRLANIERVAARKKRLQAMKPPPNPDYRKRNGNDNEIYTNDPPEKIHKCLNCKRPKCSGDCPEMHRRKEENDE